MTLAVPSHAGAHTMAEREAQHLWSWLLRRQGLCDDAKYASVVEIVQASLGLHAARLPSPFATVLARGKAPTVALSLFEPDTQNDVVTLRCMRKTLHTLPLPLAAVAHGATLHFRERDALRAIANADVSARAITRTTTAIVDLLGRSGPLFFRDIETRLVSGQTDIATVRLALKLAWERGVLAYLNQANCWNREHRKFGLTSSLYPGLDMAMDRSKAAGELVREYFDRYGPASLRDVAWWSGLSRSAITTAMNDLALNFVLVRTSWCASPMYMYEERFEQFRESTLEQRHSGVNFLAHEDVALKAYFESRRRYLGELPARKAFNQIGEVLPTIVRDGLVVGTWAWDAKSATVTWSIASPYRSAALQREIRQRAHILSDALRLGWAGSDRPRSK